MDKLARYQEVVKELFTNAHGYPSDYIYYVRESEGKGWDGPAVKGWGDACSKAEKLLKEDGLL